MVEVEYIKQELINHDVKYGLLINDIISHFKILGLTLDKDSLLHVLHNVDDYLLESYDRNELSGYYDCYKLIERLYNVSVKLD